ncbi:hypothetical protein [Porcipelethomonas sp.]|uniref:hypothetical protein n=1 Tax=Porcipelethomonas sp. TaxID=2981675 RepID=UPI003EFA8AB2
MNKTFKKIAASIMAVTTLTVSMVGMSASAYSDSVYFMRDAGAPSSAGTTSATWNYKADISTSTITVSNFTRTDKTSRIYAYISSAGIANSGFINPSGGSVAKNGIVPGAIVYASAELNNYSGTIRANVSISG